MSNEPVPTIVPRTLTKNMLEYCLLADNRICSYWIDFKHTLSLCLCSGDALHKILCHFKVSNVLGHGRLLLKQKLESMSVHDLKVELAKRRLLILGNKATLIQRLKDALLPGEKVRELCSCCFSTKLR